MGRFIISIGENILSLDLSKYVGMSLNDIINNITSHIKNNTGLSLSKDDKIVVEAISLRIYNDLNN